MTARPTAAPARFPYWEHRSQAEIMFGPLSLVPGGTHMVPKGLMSEADILARRVYREPCPRCGVRADIGCPHSNHRDGLASTRGAAASFTPVRGAATSSAARR
jgi:hypothetical protein